MNARSIGPFTLLGVLGLAGCVGGGSGGGGGDAGPPRVDRAASDEAIELTAELFCDMIRACPQSSSAEAVISAFAAHGGDCVATLADDIRRIDGRPPEIVVADPAGVDACRRVMLESCLPPNELAACVELITGPAAAGELCGAGRSCGPGSMCLAGFGDGRCGLCVPRTAPGERCFEERECGVDGDRVTRCLPDPETGDDVCRPLDLRTGAPLGAPCGDLVDDSARVACASPFYCRRARVGGVRADEGVCAAPLDEGEPCERRVDACADSGLCGPACDAAGQCADVCIALLLAREGEPCDDAGPICNPFERQVCVDGRCAPSDPTEGGLCADQPGARCGDGLWCDLLEDTGQCRVRRADGEPCALDEMCQSGVCDDGVCQPYIPSCVGPPTE